MDWSTFLNQQGQALIGAKVQAEIKPPVSTNPMTGQQYQDGKPATSGTNSKISPLMLIGGGLLTAGLLFVLLRK